MRKISGKLRSVRADTLPCASRFRYFGLFVCSSPVSQPFGRCPAGVQKGRILQVRKQSGQLSNANEQVAQTE